MKIRIHNNDFPGGKHHNEYDGFMLIATVLNFSGKQFLGNGVIKFHHLFEHKKKNCKFLRSAWKNSHHFSQSFD